MNIIPKGLLEQNQRDLMKDHVLGIYGLVLMLLKITER